MGRVPLIIPTPCGYQFAREIYRHLTETYLPRRKQKSNGVWVDTEMFVFADTDQMTGILKHIRGGDAYIIADVESSATILPTETVDNRPPSHRIEMREGAYTVYHGKNVLPVSPRRVSVPRNFDMFLSTVDAVRNAVKEEGHVTAVLPCFPSARQDRRGGRRSLDLKRRFLEMDALGVNRVLTNDIHNESTELAVPYRMGFDNLYSRKTLVDFLRARGLRDNIYVISPDEGAYKKIAKRYAKDLGTGVGLLDKSRDQPNVIDAVGTGVGIIDVAGKNILLVDDMIDTAGTTVEAAEYLRDRGAASVIAITAHAVFSPPAIDRLEKAVAKGHLNEVIVTNSVTHPDAIKERQWLTTVDVAKYFAKAIDRLNVGDSISALLDDDDEEE
jgi:ribose-phosphate pyrophosphokinase